MNRMRPLLMRFTAIAFLAGCVAMSQTSSAAVPAPPTQLCVNNVCTSGTGGGTNGAIKWHPGHYTLSDTQPSFYGADFSSEIAQMAAVTASGGGPPAMKGFKGMYSWYWTEPSEGVYNWSLIDNDLATLAALSAQYGVDFKLIIEFTLADTGAHAPPSVPQPTPYSSGSSGYRNGMVPDYIIRGISGLGTDIVLSRSMPEGGYQAIWWRPAVNARYCALLAAAGARYDSNPHVEMIIPFQEVGIGMNIGMPSDYSSAAAVTGWNNISRTVATSWPQSVKIFNNNWYWTNSQLSDLLAISQYAVSQGFGFGGPDILYSPQQTETNGSMILRGAGGGYGTSDYRGKIPSAYEEQADYGVWINETSAGVETYAYNTLESTHVMWGNHGTYGNSWGASGDNWSDVVAALQAQNFRIHSACPAEYVGGCNKN
jgi:hypothetical protein